jgi:hypothetical protein
LLRVLRRQENACSAELKSLIEVVFQIALIKSGLESQASAPTIVTLTSSYKT